MNRISYLEIAEKKYPLSFSLAASKKIAQKYGSVEKMADLLTKSDGMTEKAVDEITFIIELLIAQGCAYMNLFESDVPPYEKAPIKDGKYIPPTKEEIEIGVSFTDLKTMLAAIFGAMSSGSKTTISTKQSKNGQIPEGQASISTSGEEN